jgi:hypothetical protein
MAGHELGRPFAPVVQRTIMIGQSRMAPSRLGVAQEEQGLHGIAQKNPFETKD